LRRWDGGAMHCCCNSTKGAFCLVVAGPVLCVCVCVSDEGSESGSESGRGGKNRCMGNLID